MNTPCRKQDSNSPLLKITRDLAEGLLYNHARITYNTQHTLKASSFLYALIDLLAEKGVLTIEDLDQRKKVIAEKLIQNFEDSRIGLLYQEPEEDKYVYQSKKPIDCASRLSVCKAICCKIPFALSKQDVEERTIRWEFGRPYLIAHDQDGYCVHLDRETWRCQSYEQRPVPCRGFNCNDNERWHVWDDYAAMLLNRDFSNQINESNQKMYSYSK